MRDKISPEACSATYALYAPVTPHQFAAPIRADLLIGNIRWIGEDGVEFKGPARRCIYLKEISSYKAQEIDRGAKRLREIVESNWINIATIDQLARLPAPEAGKPISCGLEKATSPKTWLKNSVRGASDGPICEYLAQPFGRIKRTQLTPVFKLPIILCPDNAQYNPPPRETMFIPARDNEGGAIVQPLATSPEARGQVGHCPFRPANLREARRWRRCAPFLQFEREPKADQISLTGRDSPLWGNVAVKLVIARSCVMPLIARFHIVSCQRYSHPIACDQALVCGIG